MNEGAIEVVRTDAVEVLLLDLLHWLAGTPRVYTEVMDAWRTSCPRLPVWEEANRRHFVTLSHTPGSGLAVSASAVGLEHLRLHRDVASS